MHAIVLAAGEGSRLRPHTISRPKCLVPLAGRPLLEHQLNVLRKCNVKQVTVVTGYRGDQIQKMGLTVINNPEYESTNMVASLSCASDLLDGSNDILITYGDIVYEAHVLKALISCSAPLAISIDRDWLNLWRTRMPNPLTDAETLRLDACGKVLEIGQPPASLESIEGQYMGLVKIAAPFAKQFAMQMNSLKISGPIKGRTWATMDMTTFLQHLVDIGFHVQSVPVQGGWLEVDSTEDLATYEQLHRSDRLGKFWKPEAA